VSVIVRTYGIDKACRSLCDREWEPEKQSEELVEAAATKSVGQDMDKGKMIWSLQQRLYQ
jgi:hypothetical protein